MKLIIAGGRDFNDLQKMKENVPWHQITELVCGEARGADTLGKKYLLENNFNIPIKSFIPDWDKDGKAAGHIRNRQMGDYADALIAFWDGESKGTKGMIDYMKKLGKPVKVVYY